MLQRKVQNFIAQNGLLEPGAKVLAGVSGGADSTALLLLLKALGYRCIAVHCNFHLRGSESDRDQQFVSDLCAGLGVQLELCSYDTEKYAREHRISIEMAARELRYADFERIRVETGAQAICIAHHRDDSVETVLMNLMRGTGIRGLGGIRPRNGYIVRPLLCVSRKEIEDWLEKQGQAYVTDSTNLEADCTRNRIRLQILPVMRQTNPGTDAAIDRTSAHVRQALAFYEEAVSKAKSEVANMCDDGCDIDFQKLLSLDPEGVNHMKARAVLFEILSGYGFSESQAEQAFLAANEPGRCFYAGCHVLSVDRGRLLVRKDDEYGYVRDIEPEDGLAVEVPDGCLSFRFAPGDAPISKDPNVATLDADLAGSSLQIRNVRNGDSFHPFGMKGRRLLSDFMTDLKFSVPQKRRQLVLTDGKDILWVVGQRSDNRFRVSAGTSRQLVITLTGK